MGIQLHFIVFILLLISLWHSSDKFFFCKTMVTLITVFFLQKSGSNFVNLIRQNPSICESDISEMIKHMKTLNVIISLEVK